MNIIRLSEIFVVSFLLSVLSTLIVNISCSKYTFFTNDPQFMKNVNINH